MKAQGARVLTSARVIALALRAVLAVGLAYLRVAPDGGSAAVPAGTRAGDLVNA